jgi:ATP adenylyltransferase
MEHLWAPWRKAYVQDASTPRGEIFARLAQAPAEDDAANHIVWRGKACFAVLNLYPYNTGHTLVVPYRVVADLDQLAEDELLECLTGLKRIKAALTEAFRPHGFNIGLNLGSAAGAGIEQHLHWHLVPRAPRPPLERRLELHDLDRRRPGPPHRPRHRPAPPPGPSRLNPPKSA